MTERTMRGTAPDTATSGTAPRTVLIIVTAGVVLAGLDLFVVNVALPQIARDLDTSNLGELSWVLNGYAIVYASLLVFFGRLADRYRRDLGFLVGVALFTVASAACAAASSVGMLIAFRLIQAAGGALMTPTSLGLILAAYAPERRAGAVRAWTASSGVAAALGPVIGGLLVTASWRWVFLINVPIGIAALIAGWRLLPHIPGHRTERPDALGVILATAGIAVLTFGLVKGSDWGWGSASVALTLAAAAVLIALFVLHCLRARSPLIHLSLFKNRTFTGASVVSILFSSAFGGMLLSVVLWEQGAWGWSALRAGLAIAPGPLMVPLVAFGVGGRLIRRFGPGPVIAVGCLAFGGGLSWWATAVTVHPDYVSGMLGGMLLGGVGVGLTMPTFMAAGSSSLPPQSFATGSAVINMLRQTGLALGVAILVAVLGNVSYRGSGVLATFRDGWWVLAALAFASIIPALALLGRPARRTAAGSVMAEPAG